MKKKRDRTFDERMRLHEEMRQKGEAKEVPVTSKRKTGEDYREKLIREGKHFQDKVIEKESKRTGGERDPTRKGRHFRPPSPEEKLQASEEAFREENTFSPASPRDSLSQKREPLFLSAEDKAIEKSKRERHRKEALRRQKEAENRQGRLAQGKVYDPLSKDSDNDGIADRYDNNFQDSDYFESTYDVEDPKASSPPYQETGLKKKRNRKIGADFHKRQNKEEALAKNYDDASFTRTRGKEDPHQGKDAVKERQKKNLLVKQKKKAEKAAFTGGVLSLGEKGQDLAKDYLSSGQDENVGVEGAEKALGANSKLFRHQKRSLNKRQGRKDFHRHEGERTLQKKKSKLDFRDETERVKGVKEADKKEAYRTFYKRKQMKASIQERKNRRLLDRIKESLKSGAISFKNFIVRKSKAFLLIMVAVVILGTFLISFGGSSLSLFSNTASTTLATSYLSDEKVLKDIESYFFSLEEELRETIKNVESTHPGYDEYIVRQDEYVGHNVHELLSYITARCGEVKSLSEVKVILDELFKKMYELTYEEEIEIRYRTVTDTYVDKEGNELTESREEPYEYKKLIVTLKKRPMDELVREAFKEYPDNLRHYETLFYARGNMGDVFGNADLIASNGGIGGGQEYEASSEVQKSIVDACYITPSPGAGWCAMWVSQVYQNAGLGYIGGNANDMYRNFTYTSDPSELQVGMLVAVESSSSGGELGAIYGHVGIYIGDGKVMDNIGKVRVTSLENWIATFCKHSPPGFGFPPSVQK